MSKIELIGDRESLAAQWHQNEAELVRLRELPAGYMDPAARERELNEIPDEVKRAIAVEWQRTRRTWP